MNGIFLALLCAVCTVVLLSAISVLPACAAGELPRLVDGADLLSDSEESDLSDLLDGISERQQVDVVVVTVNSMEGETAVVYADDFYDYNGYGFGDKRDGILLLISMEERDWCISTRGYGITAFTDAGQEYISEQFVSDLSAGDYAEAFTNFAKLCDDFITQAKTGEPYDVNNLPPGSFEPVWGLLTALAIAFVISLIVTGFMKGQLKSVHSQFAADNYIKQGSMQLTKKNDLFLYKHVDRRKKPENNSSNNSNHSNRSSSSGGSRTHRSSSGATHGGSRGKF
ncbi:MAG: TPM domain-containing protein [Lachnospiraceae bacterium]|nr:TPM domain-containing protein [Lachnospiraceae bacterium]